MEGLQMFYFVLKPGNTGWHGRASRAAIRAYAMEMETDNPKMAQQLRDWADAESMRVDGVIRQPGFQMEPQR